MKLMGLAGILLCCTMTGMYMASALSKKVERIEQSIALIGALGDRLRFLAPSTAALIEGAAGMERFANAGYLLACRDGLRRGVPFPAAWRQGIEEDAPLLGKEHAEALLPLGEVLGSVDLEGQLAALRYTGDLLQNRLEEARDYRDRHARLYRSLGVLGGIAVVVILF